ncbi:MAG: alcohol dehydrogenase catalytic domain-containing protein, partial [Thermodesulfovibrionales bacterium]
MRSWYLVKPGFIELRDVEIPEPSPHEILIKIKTALTCGTDLKAFKRGHPLIPMPGPFGHEFSGTVYKVGSEVEGFKEGDDIMAVHTAPCDNCFYCKKGVFNLCESLMTDKILGAFSEFILLPSHIVRRNVFKKPDHISFESATFLEPLSCVLHGMKKLQINEDSRIAIIGYGAIGLLHLIVLKSLGATVLVIGRDKQGLKRASDLGADEVVL